MRCWNVLIREMKIEHRLEHSESEKEYRMKSKVQRSIVYKKLCRRSIEVEKMAGTNKKKLHGCERKIVWLRILYLPEDKKRSGNLTEKTRLCWSDKTPSLVNNHSKRMRTWKTNKSKHRPQKPEHSLMQLHTKIVWRKKYWCVIQKHWSLETNYRTRMTFLVLGSTTM